MTVTELYAPVAHTDDGNCPVCTGTPYNPPKIDKTFVLINGTIYPMSTEQ
jgi:hypothetical protein